MNWDAFRPDMIDSKNTPNLFKLIERGFRFENQHAVFPSCTRVNCASLATGVYPDKHGIMGNRIYVPMIDRNKAVSNDDYKILLALDKITEGKLMLKETITHKIHTKGMTTAVVSTGSSGSAFLFDHKIGGVIVNKHMILPDNEAQKIIQHFGSIPSSSVPNSEQNDYMTNVFTQYILPELKPTISLLWLCDPDLTQHYKSLGNRDNIDALKSNDSNLGKVLEALNYLNIMEQTNLLITSDHGASTITEKVNVTDELIKEGLKKDILSTDVVVASSEGSDLIYVEDHDFKRVVNIVEFLQKQSWAGPIFTKGKNEVEGEVPGTMSLSLIHNENRRSADILFSFNWGSEKNSYGIQGTTVAESNYPPGAAMHGSFSPFDIQSILIAYGPDFKSGLSSKVPTGIIDIEPTILNILGLKYFSNYDGRVLYEALIGGPDPSEIFWKTDFVEVETKVGITRFKQLVQFSKVGNSLYFDKSLVTRF